MTPGDRLSIAELQRVRHDMAPGPYRYDHQGYIESMDRGLNHTGGETEVLTLGARNEHADGEGSVVLLNAAPVLLEIVAAALALREQEQVAAKARYRVYAALHKNATPSDEDYATTDAEDNKLARCRIAYLVALAKVRP